MKCEICHEESRNKYCGKQCKDKAAILKSNDKWLNKDTKNKKPMTFQSKHFNPGYGYNKHPDYLEKFSALRG